MALEKKTSIFYILEILKKYSDENHYLLYSDIIKLLNDNYGLILERKTIATHIDILSSIGYDIVKHGKNGLYLRERTFDNGELLFLIDSIYSSKSMPTRYAYDLVEKLMADYSQYEQKKYNNLEKLDDGVRSDNKQLFYTIEILNEAIELKKKVEFQYNSYGLNKKFTPKDNGKIYKISPYFMVNNRGKYYVICNYDKYNDLSNYKIECISEIKILDEDAKNIKDLDGCNDFSLKQYMNEHIYMTYGDSVEAKIKINSKNYINDFIDWYGKKANITETNEGIIARVKVNEGALIYWSLQYGENVEVLEPTTTRNKIREKLKYILDKYND